MFEYDKTYEFHVNASFGDMPVDIINSLYQDGRVASKFLEIQLTSWFPELEFVDAKGYDHVCSKNDRKLDAKCFTKGGLGFAPSAMVGAGRKIDEQVAREHANEIDYIACDIVNFPKIRVKFLKGSDLVKQYPSFKIPPKHREKIFAN